MLSLLLVTTTPVGAHDTVPSNPIKTATQDGPSCSYHITVSSNNLGGKVQIIPDTIGTITTDSTESKVENQKSKVENQNTKTIKQ